MVDAAKTASENPENLPQSAEEYLALIEKLIELFPVSDAYATHVGATGFLGNKRVKQTDVVSAQILLAQFLDALSDVTVAMLSQVKTPEEYARIIHYSEVALGNIHAKEFDLPRRHYALVIRKMLRIQGDKNGDACPEANNPVREAMFETLQAVRAEAGTRAEPVDACMDAEPFVLRANKSATTYDLFDLLNKKKD